MTDRHLFLKGRSGAGKTTCLLSCLEPYWKGAGGFLTQRLTDGDGETAGFSLLPVENMEEIPSVTRAYEPVSYTHLDVYKRQDGPAAYPSVP